MHQKGLDKNHVFDFSGNLVTFQVSNMYIILANFTP